MIDIKKYRINCGMGSSGDWSLVFGDKECKDLNEIGYTGKLNGVKTSLFDYIRSLTTNSVKYDLERIGGNSAEFTDIYELVVVKYSKEENMEKQSRIDEVKAEIERKKRELESLEKSLSMDKRRMAIKDLSEFSDEEKIKQFDKIYNIALSVVEEAEENGYVDEDTDHYVYEDVMGIIARDRQEFWKYFNSLT